MHSFDILESESKDLGFNVKTSKCMLWSPQTMRSLDQSIKRADPEGFEVLGAPIGTEAHHAKVLSKGWRKLSLSLIVYSNLTILMQLMAYLKFVLVLPKCCTLYAQLNQDPQLLKSYFVSTMHKEIA